MTDKERLIELMRKGYEAVPVGGFVYEGMANYLLGHGVIVAPMLNRQKAEIERLEEEKEQLKADIEMFTEIGKMYSEIKAEAVKEFAERLIDLINCIPQHHFTLGQVEHDIDNLVKEMVGED